MSSSVIRELRREYDDAPEEVPTESVGRRKHQKELSERRRYEEEYFTRLNAPKKSLKEDLMTLSSLCDDITRFEDISALDLDNPD
ncbi:neuroguidin-like protein, partial [Dinothrombium tinctorium]